MKILHTVESYLPVRHGMQEVVTQISRYLQSKGHEITILTSYNKNRASEYDDNIPIIEFDIKGNYVRGYVGAINDYQDFLKNSNFDIIVNFAAQQWATDLMLPIIKEIKGKKIFVPTGFSELKSTSYKEYYENMKLWMKDYDCNVFLSNNYQDFDFAISNGIKKNIVIPNGADKNEFEKVDFVNIYNYLKIDQTWKIILSVGSHTGYKGHDSLLKIFKGLQTEKVALLLIGNNTSNDSRLVIILKNIFNLLKIRRSLCYYSCKYQEFKLKYFYKRKKVIIKKLSRNITVNSFNQADLFLFPSMIECSPIVLFEAMAGKTAFAVSDVGNSAEIISWTDGGVLLPTSFDENRHSKVDVKKSVTLIDDLLNDQDLISTLSSNGNKSFIENFTWEKIGEKYENLYKVLFSNINSGM